MKGYFPIRLNTLRSDEAVTFDVFIKIGNRYLHYTHQNDTLEAARIKNLKSKGLRKLFILENNEDLYLLYLESGLQGLSNQAIAIDEKAEHNLETEQGYKTQKQQLSYINDFIINQKGAIKEILKVAGVSLDTNQHSATVSSLCIAVANKVEDISKEDIFDLGVAALLHDLGKNRLKFDSMKPMAQMSPAELKAYKQHPQDGADMLAGKPYINPRILGLIASHEERGEGRGYPEKKIISKLPISYQILSMVNQFDHFCSDNKLLATNGIDPFFEKFGNDYSDELITILATVLT